MTLFRRNPGAVAALALSAAWFGSASTVRAELLARDLDGTPITVEAYYDTALDITWMADAALSIPRLGSAGQYDGGSLEAIGSVALFGTTGWRASAALDPTCVSTPESCAEPGPNATELAHLWRGTLGNAIADPLGPLANPGPFRNVYPAGALFENASASFWVGPRTCTETINEVDRSGKPVTYSFATYLQQMLWDFGGPGVMVNAPQYVVARIWLVHDGDIVAVPEPAAFVCVGLGLAAAILARRWRPGSPRSGQA